MKILYCSIKKNNFNLKNIKKSQKFCDFLLFLCQKIFWGENMKWVLSLFGIVLSMFSCFCFKQKSEESDFLRIHIVANSNSSEDEKVKYLVKDAIVEFLIPFLSQAKTENEAEMIVEENLEKICEVANNVLASENFDYQARVFLKKEKMPTRSYDGFTLEEGVYNGLRVELGKAKGDNWWCVIFPAVCFLDTKNFENVEYISKIWEIINNVKQNQGG